MTPQLKLFLNLATVQAMLTRRFDSGLGGLGLSEFMILYHLEQSRDEKMRRIELAERIGLTASGITRLLAPMEKIGLVKRESNARDARVSLVSLAPGGKRKLSEALTEAEVLAEDMLPSPQEHGLKEMSELLLKLGAKIK
jgi:DNA-binding MarR family transcriptional regulator